MEPRPAEPRDPEDPSHLAGPAALSRYLEHQRLIPRAVVEFSAPGGFRRCAAGRLEVRSASKLSVAEAGGGDPWSCHGFTCSHSERLSEPEHAGSTSLTFDTDDGGRTGDVASGLTITVAGLRAPSTLVSVDGESEIWRHSDAMVVSVVPSRVRVVEPWRDVAPRSRRPRGSSAGARA